MPTNTAPGNLTFLQAAVLTLINDAAGSHFAAITQACRQRDASSSVTENGIWYALKRLQHQGFIEAGEKYRVEGVRGGARKPYFITSLGKKVLREFMEGLGVHL